MSIYIGDVGNIAHDIGKIYVGDVNNIAKEVKKIYVGDINNIAKEVYSSGPVFNPLITARASGTANNPAASEVIVNLSPEITPEMKAEAIANGYNYIAFDWSCNLQNYTGRGDYGYGIQLAYYYYRWRSSGGWCYFQEGSTSGSYSGSEKISINQPDYKWIFRIYIKQTYTSAIVTSTISNLRFSQ